MKKNILIAGLVLLSMSVFSQESLATLSGGYSFANIEDSDVKGTGWRINGLYEFNPLGGMFAHGFSVGYISLSASEGIGQQAIDISVNSFPLYYAPKVMFGNEKIKAFIKGAIGTQYSNLKKEGLVELSDFDFGFYGGGGAGIMIFFNEKMFINAEYEIAYASNSWYKDGWMNTAMAGVGFRF
jgi:hypothetical protein